MQAVVTVSDRTAGPLAAISARLRAIAGMNGLQRVQAATQMVRRQFSALAGTITRLAVPLAALAGAGTAGLYAMTRATVDAGGAWEDLSFRLGIAVRDLQALDYAGRQTGVTSEAMAASLERLQRGIGDAAAGRNQDLAALFQRLRIPLRDANGALRTAADLMPELADAFQRNENATVRTRMAMALFGRAGGPLIGMLQEGRDALAGNIAEWGRLNGVIGTDQAAMLARVGDSLTRVQEAMLGLRNAIVVHLAPALEPMLNNLAEWIARNREIISSTLARWVQQLGDALAGVDWAAVVEEIRGFLRVVRDVVEQVGGWRTALLAVGAYMAGPLIVSIGLLAAAITSTLIPPLLRATGLLAALRTGGAAALAAGGAAARVGAAVVGSAAGGAAAAGAVGAAGVLGLGLGLYEVQRQGQQNQRAAAESYERGEVPGVMGGAQRQAIQDFLRANPPGGGSSLFRPQSAPAPAAPPQGQVDVRVRLENLPRGSQVDARAEGAGLREPRLDVGFAAMGVP